MNYIAKKSITAQSGNYHDNIIILLKFVNQKLF